MGEGLGAAWAASAGPKLVAAAIAFVGTLRFVKWLIIFVCDRLDVGHARLAKRLRHVEEELDAYREATMLLISALAKRDPTNKALLDAGRILRTTAPRSTMDLDELERRLGEIPARGEE